MQLIKPSEAQKIGLHHHEEFLSRFVINTLHKVPNTATVSNRTVQINFRKYFGYSVKEKNRYERFKQVILYILSSNTSTVKWVERIRQFEYYDYSHLYKDFRKFLSITPEDFLQNVNDFCIPKRCYLQKLFQSTLYIYCHPCMFNYDSFQQTLKDALPSPMLSR